MISPVIDLQINPVMDNTQISEEDKERALLNKIAEGDEIAFRSFFYKYLPLLLPYVKKFTKSDVGAEEVIQNAFLRVWLNRERLVEINNAKAWLFRYVSNECLSYLRTEKRKRAEDLESCNLDTIPSIRKDCTNEQLQLNEVNHLINQAVELLPAQRKKVFQMSRSEGLSIPEIASQLDLSANTVKNTLVTSLKFIREFLSSHGYHFSIFLLLFLKK